MELFFFFLPIHIMGEIFHLFVQTFFGHCVSHWGQEEEPDSSIASSGSSKSSEETDR